MTSSQSHMTSLLSPDNDTLIFIDFRADRMRQIVEALGIKPQFETDTIPNDLVSILFSLRLTPFPMTWSVSCLV